MDITAGDGWEKLCPFIGHDIPDMPFPFVRRAEDRERRQRERKRRKAMHQSAEMVSQ